MEPLKLPGPKARALIKRDSAVISPSYPRGVPFVMDHGRGTGLPFQVIGARWIKSRQVCEHLAALRLPETLTALLSALQDDDPIVVAAAAEGPFSHRT